jgi:hypothetical protein
MKRIIFIFFSSSVTLMLTACPPVTRKTINLSPTWITTSYQAQYSQNSFCDVPLPGQGLFLNGLGPEPFGPGEIIVGYEDIFDKGADPFPCEEEQQMLYRGRVVFDLSIFQNITSATLVYNVNRSEAQTAGPNQIPPMGYATTLGIATLPKDEGNGPYFWDFDNPVTLPTCNGGVIKPDCSLNVSSQVSQWISLNLPPHPTNRGFIFAGPILDTPSDLPQDNNGNLTWYDSFQLRVIYNPKLNPNAPQ